jgi:uncharacterized protein YdhG (YjbR/CyaY superfamily)
VKPTTVSQYIAAAPAETRAKLREMRATIASAAPGATQALKWSMPAFSYDRILVTFAAFKHHIGFYPTPSAVRAFRKELGGYRTATGSIRFPLDRPLPRALIRKITAFRVVEANGKNARWRSSIS